MLPTDAQRVALHNYPQTPGHPPGYPGPQPPPSSHHPQQHRGDRKLAFGQLRQAVSSRLCDLLDEAGIHATRVVSGRRFVRWDTVPNLLAQQNAYISGLPYEFFFAKAAAATGPGAAITATTTNASTSNTAMMTSSSSTNTFTPPGGSNTNTNTASQQSQHTGYSLPPSQNDDEEDVSMNPFDGMSSIPDAGATFGSLPPLRFPSGAPAYHPHSHSSIQVDEGFNANNDATHNNPVNNTTPHDTTPHNNNADDYDSDDNDDGAEDITQTLIAQLHAQPLNINILSWKKQTIEHILDGLDRGRIRVLARPQGRDVVFQLELPSSMNIGTGAGTVPGAGGRNSGPGGVGGGGNSGSDGGNSGATAAVNTVDIPRWPNAYPHAHSNALTLAQSQPYLQGQPGVAFPQQSIGNSGQSNNSNNKNNGPSTAGGGPVRNLRPDRERRRKWSTNTNASTATGSAGSEATTSSWSGGSGHGYQAYGDQESLSVPDGTKRETLGDERTYDGKGYGQGHGRNGSGSGSGMTMGGGGGGGPSVVPLVHNHTLTPSPFRSHYQDYPQSSRHAQQKDGQFGTLQSNGGPASQQPLLAGVQHVSRPILSSSSSSTVGSFLTTPTPTKKWTRRSSPDRIFMNVTLNGILRAAGMPIPRQKDDASRLPWSSIPQFLAENGLYISGWPEANLPWLYSGDMGARASAIGATNMGMGMSSASGNGGGGGTGATGMGEWRDRIDWKSSPSQRSYKPLAQALKSGDIRILSRPRGRDVLFEVRDAQGRYYDSTLSLSDEWKEKYMRDSVVGSPSPPAPQASSSGAGDLQFVNLASPGRGHGSNLQVRQQQRSRDDILDEDEPEEEERERGRPGYHSRSTSYLRSGSSWTRNTAMDFDLPSPTETSASTSSGATKRPGHHPFSSGYYSARTTPPGATPDAAPRVGYQNLAFPSEHAKPSPLAYRGKASPFPPNQFHDIHGQPRRSTPPTTFYDRDGPPSGPSGIRFPQLLNRQHSESIVHFQRPGFPTAEASNGNSCRSTPSPDSSQRQRTVSLGTSSASTGTGTALCGSSSGVPAFAFPSRGGGYNLPSLSHGAMDVDMDLGDPSLNHLPPLIHLNSDGEVHGEDESRPLIFPSISPLPLKRSASASTSSGLLSPPLGSISSSSLPTHLPSPLVAFSQPTWSTAERGWKLNVLDPARASLPPVGDMILWDVEKRSWKLTWAADAGSSIEGRSPAALWSTEQDAWILDS